jgi:IclR family pca regulon transcriptional regulator
VTADAGENAPDARYSVHSLELGLRILESFDRDAVDEMSLSEMARRIGVSRSSAFRLVHTLQRLGYLEREDETKNYRLGARVMNWRAPTCNACARRRAARRISASSTVPR